MGFLSKIGKIAGIAGPVASFIPGGQAIGAGLTALGGLSAGEGSAQDARDFASAQAVQANQFTKEQLQNRHQWEVADLKAAGLNPVLSAMKGAPSIGGSAMASTGATAGSETADYVSSASSAHQQILNTKKLQSEIDLLRANATAAKTQGVKNLAEASKSTNESEISKNWANISKGFHGLTSSTAKFVREKIDPDALWRHVDKVGEGVKNKYNQWKDKYNQWKGK